MAKRSPILGYNHNVRYRGLIFHVQTEDSGVLSPHLFTHMFYGGVIVSTRKLVYDAGAAEESIKSLMQAQHKAVLKDLKRGVMDDKIDEYLGSTEGLLPRGVKDDGDRPSDPVITIEDSPEPLADADLVQVADGAPRTIAPPPPIPQRAATPPPVPTRTSTPQNAAPAAPPRTITSERKSAPSQVRTSLPPAPSADLDPITELNPIVVVASGHGLGPPTMDFEEDESPRSEPDIQIYRLELDELTREESAGHRRRASHDTDIQMPGGGVPTATVDDARTLATPASDGIPTAGRPTPTSGRYPANESVPPLPPPPKKPTGERSAVGAASLPPVRPLTGRPALTTPTVMSRPLTPNADERSRGSESDGVEVYAPAPPGVDPPPGAIERPGAYAQHSRSRSKPHTIPEEIPPARERPTGGMAPIPAGLGRPRAGAGGPGTGPIPRAIAREPSSGPTRARVPDSGGVPHQITPAPTVPMRSPIPSPASRPPSGSTPVARPGEPVRARTPTPSRASVPRTPNASSGVVMTRPAVIVGAPPKPAAPRVRKAREEEGRGFGQGLISEKSLDEVILAYLSEDADDK